MNINNVKGMMNYNNVLHGTNNKSKLNSISNQFNHFKDAVELSSTGKTVMETLDKGHSNQNDTLCRFLYL